MEAARRDGFSEVFAQDLHVVDVNDSELSNEEELDFNYIDDSLTDNETIDYDQVNASDMRNNINKECGACSKI